MRQSSVPRQAGPTISVRARLLVAVVSLVTAALAFAGLVGYGVQRQRVERHVVDHLALEGADLADFVREPNTTSTLPGPAPEDLLEAALARRSLTASEGVMGFVGTSVRWVGPIGAPVRPEQYPDLLAQVAPLAVADVTSLGEYRGFGRDFRYVVVPLVIAPTGERAALVTVVDMDAELSPLRGAMATYGLAAAGAVLLVGLLAWLVAGRLLQPVAWVRRAAEAIGDENLDVRIPVRGHDDLSALTRTLNGMLDRIQNAVEGQRRLIDDVGHELRTPVTIVSGHLQVMDPQDPEDAVATRDLCLEELGRMGGLVSDLLTLATSDRPDFVRPVPVELARLTDETLERAHVLGDRRWRIDALATEQALVDPERITQAWLQLAANAVRYSEVGSEVGLGSEVRGDHVWLWVRDQGVGIDPKDHDLVLSRFGRAPVGTEAGAGTSRPRSAGLGLAIVSSIAAAHGGRVDIDSEPRQRRGSTISLVLPWQVFRDVPSGTRPRGDTP